MDKNNTIQLLNNIGYSQLLKSYINRILGENENNHKPIYLEMTYYSHMSGGNSNEIINKICYKQNNNSGISDIGKTITFLFNTKQNNKKHTDCNFYKAGTYTAVYIVNKPNNNEDFIMRVTERPSLDIEKYKKDIDLEIKENMPDYLYYGPFLVKDKQFYYSIGQKYNTIDDLIKESFDKRKIFFHNLLKLLSKLQNKTYLINDFKPDNIAYDKRYNPIIIDYDPKTIDTKTDILGPQTFYCFRETRYKDTKQTIDGFVYFIFKLFFIDAFTKIPVMYNPQTRCHEMNTPRKMRDKIKTIKANNDVPLDFFGFLKNIIIDDTYSGLFGNDAIVPTYQDILNKFELL